MIIAELLLLVAASTPVMLECPTIPGQRLAYVDIYDGPLEQNADLAPDQTTKTSNIWQLSAGPQGLYVKCGYGEKLEGPYSHLETIRLPDVVKSCQADFATDRAGNFVAVRRFSCK